MDERERLMKLIADIPKAQTIPEMADYLLENGIIVPPVKVGDTVYTNIPDSWWLRDKDLPCKAKVAYINIDSRGKYINIAINKHFTQSVTFNEIGDTVFLTREEAEKALAERSDKE